MVRTSTFRFAEVEPPRLLPRLDIERWIRFDIECEHPHVVHDTDDVPGQIVDGREYRGVRSERWIAPTIRS